MLSNKEKLIQCNACREFYRFFATSFNSIFIIGAVAGVDLSAGLANSKCSDQLAHPRRLISAFAIRFLESIMFKLSTSKI